MKTASKIQKEQELKFGTICMKQMFGLKFCGWQVTSAQTLYFDSAPSGSTRDTVRESRQSSRPPLVTLGCGGPGVFQGTEYAFTHLVCCPPMPNRDEEAVCK